MHHSLPIVENIMYQFNTDCLDIFDRKSPPFIAQHFKPAFDGLHGLHAGFLPDDQGDFHMPNSSSRRIYAAVISLSADSNKMPSALNTLRAVTIPAVSWET